MVGELLEHCSSFWGQGKFCLEYIHLFFTSPLLVSTVHWENFGGWEGGHGSPMAWLFCGTCFAKLRCCMLFWYLHLYCLCCWVWIYMWFELVIFPVLTISFALLVMSQSFLMLSCCHNVCLFFKFVVAHCVSRFNCSLNLMLIIVCSPPPSLLVYCHSLPQHPPPLMGTSVVQKHVFLPNIVEQKHIVYDLALV